MIVGIVDYGLSNLTCVRAAVERLGHEAFVGSTPDVVERSDKVILPGVGAFGDAIANLRNSGMADALDRQVRDGGKPFLGICLGAQLVCRDSDEHGHYEGLGWADAHVRRLAPGAAPLRVPHTGWDDVKRIGDTPLFTGVPIEGLFYYTHSHAIYPEDDAIVLGTCEYGTPFAAALHIGENIYATQFHPEKSQKHGLALLGNFLERC